jgi:predicted alpha/beta superfamily hydrolase
MKKILSYFAVALVTSAVSFIVLDNWSGNLVPKKGVVYATVYSSILQEDRDVIIRLPRLYDSTKRYPVMYVLDGSSLDIPIAENLHVLTAAGYAPEAIVVGIPNMSAENREINLTPPFMRRENENPGSLMGEADNFLDFMEKDLIPFIEQKYACSSRVFCGNSRGGLVVMYSLIRKSVLFDARICFSTPFWRQDDILIDSVASYLKKTDSLKTFIYMSAGGNETENIRGGLNRMTEVLMKNSGTMVHSEITPGAIHQDNAVHSSASAVAKWAVFSSK